MGPTRFLLGFRPRSIFGFPRQMDLWERGIYAGLVGNTEAEGAAREGRSACGGKEEYNTITRN